MQQIQRLSIPWFGLGLLGLWLGTWTLRIWGLSRFNELVFDEVYYAQYGYDYLTQTPFFDAHPPLGKYLIGLGIWIAQRLPWDYATYTNQADLYLPTLSYRWINALVGSLIPILVVGIAYQLSQRRSYALIAGTLTAWDGFLLVESRYALLSIQIVFWGLLGHYCFLRGLEHHRLRRAFWLTCAGIGLGAAAAVKWYGLGFWLGLVSLWPCYRLRLWSQLTYLGIVPVGVYLLLWMPHLQQNPSPGLLALHRQIFSFHLNLSGNAANHPYCSSWLSWPLMQRPMGYLYKTVAQGPSSVIYDVHGMGNPVLWWLGAASMVGLWVLLSVRYGRYWLHLGHGSALVQAELRPAEPRWLGIYLLVNYVANWLPWSQVNRCSFIYYYLNAVLFAFMTLAWFIDQGLQSAKPWRRIMAISTILLILMAFVFWMPIYLGLPLTPEAFHQRMWFRSWY